MSRHNININKGLTDKYDNNYYYPKSSGKVIIDIYILDNGGIWTNHIDFDTKIGENDYHIVSCDGCQSEFSIYYTTITTKTYLSSTKKSTTTTTTTNKIPTSTKKIINILYSNVS
ncbi:hypothetical protein BCR32DRAFT_247214 [Anaeromyces robustus]|uniref:Uncharacterized protein n=1 Tax=Anaeromyces robustus TaxID=1754192 RepID=A0A1Y1WXS2_9FUNG|nr:hypothetical protein BCR32DRAFT_247214 [Anaeromyces robustus]|eukprot:ORX78350.1 hypothetical protein BCR32DRAFT_247214 [Anaeromyces robustus]